MQAIRDADGQLLPHVHVTDGMNGLSNGKVDDHGIDVVPYSEHSTKAAPGTVQPARRGEDEDEEDEDLAQLDVDNADQLLAVIEGGAAELLADMQAQIGLVVALAAEEPA